MWFWSFLGEVKAAFTSIDIDQDSGVVLQNRDADPRHVLGIRIWNLIEPVAVFGAILLVIWVSMLDPALWWVKPCFWVLGLWALVVSQFVHYPFEKDLFLTEAQRKRGVWFYFFECRGLGNPIRYFFSVVGEPPHIKKHAFTILFVTLFIDLLFICAFITFHEEIAERLSARVGDSMLKALLIRLGFLVTLNAGLILVGYPWMLRLDNFRKAIRFMVGFVILISVMAIAGNLLFHLNEDTLRESFKDNPYMSLRGARAIDRLTGLNVFAVGGQWSGYVFWGFLQQLLFLGVFATQLSRAFDVGRSKLQLLLSCLMTATIFGLIHVPNFWLSTVTWIGGFFGALFSMQCRNLFAFGIVHGYGGTMMNKLLPINFSVGPSEVPR